MWWSAEDYAELNWRFDKDGRRIWAPCGIIPVAALYLASQLGFGMMFGTIPKRPAFATYAKRMFARPAAVRAREIDDALLPPRD
jgi:glutathione S-transferase